MAAFARYGWLAAPEQVNFGDALIAAFGRPNSTTGNSPRLRPSSAMLPVAQSDAQDRLLKTVDRIDSRDRSHWTVHAHVDSHDAVAIAIDLCELIEAR
jgi:hypothetical protein